MRDQTRYGLYSPPSSTGPAHHRPPNLHRRTVGQAGEIHNYLCGAAASGRVTEIQDELPEA